MINLRNKGKLKVSGRVKINGMDVNSASEISEISGYVQQEDIFIGFLKVKEQLIFQVNLYIKLSNPVKLNLNILAFLIKFFFQKANLRMEKKSTKTERMERVKKVLEELNLKKCEDTLIGIPEMNVKGISGGERRRLAFACEVKKQSFCCNSID